MQKYTPPQHPLRSQPIQHQLKPQISSEYVWLRNPKSHHINHLNQVCVRTGMFHLEAKFRSIYGPVKLENKLTASTVQCRHRITVTDSPISKGEKIELWSKSFIVVSFCLTYWPPVVLCCFPVTTQDLYPDIFPLSGLILKFWSKSRGFKFLIGFFFLFC